MFEICVHEIMKPNFFFFHKLNIILNFEIDIFVKYKLEFNTIKPVFLNYRDHTYSHVEYYNMSTEKNKRD